MTIAQMHIAVKLGLDKSSALDLPAYEPEEIDLWLNKAMLKFIKTRYSGMNAKKESFEQTQKRIDDLAPLVKNTTLALIADITEYPNAYKSSDTWPTDYMFAISEEVNADSLSDKRLGITQCTHDRYRQAIDNPYSEHILHYNNAKPLRLFDDDYVKLITDGTYTLDAYYLTYLREPASVDVDGDPDAIDCELPDHTHEEIIEMAVSMMLENIEQPRYKSHAGEVATME